jgi:2Fe-2S ferredoxin
MDALVHFPTHGRSVRVPFGTPLIDAVREAGLPIARSCGGEGLCGRCGVRILDGGATVAAEDRDEVHAKERNRVDPDLRLACRVQVRADLAVAAPYW